MNDNERDKFSVFVTADKLDPVYPVRRQDLRPWTPPLFALPLAAFVRVHEDLEP